MHTSDLQSFDQFFVGIGCELGFNLQNRVQILKQGIEIQAPLSTVELGRENWKMKRNESSAILTSSWTELWIGKTENKFRKPKFYTEYLNTKTGYWF